MNVISCRVENIKGCELADVMMNENGLTVIGGDNHQGKSSFLDGICMALGGKKLFPPKPVREGEDEAEVTVKLTGGTDSIPWPCTVTRTIKQSEKGTITTKVSIESDDGDFAPTPQGLLNELLGAGLGFDPLAFVRQKPRDQVETLKALVGLDFADLDEKREKVYSERTRVNRDIKALDGKIKKTEIHVDLPSEEKVDVSALVSQLESAERANSKEMQQREEANRCHQSIKELERSIHEAEERIKRWRLEIAGLSETVKKIGEQRTELIDTAPIKEKIKSAGDINAKIDQNRASLELRTEKKSLEAESKKLTKTIESIDKEKRQMMQDAEWPMEGLGFNEDGVTLNDTPFEQLSSSEQLRAAVAVALTMNPNFPFAIIRDGSLLDKDTLLDVAAVAEAHKGQVLLERVSKGAECHVVFENGRRVSGK